jgi:GxxExxY protein
LTRTYQSTAKYKERGNIMEYEDLTHKIIGCAYTVFNKLGFGFLESVYRKAMVIELSKAGLSAEEEKPVKVYYDDQVVGNFSADLYIEDLIIIELKSLQSLLIEHEVQLVNYLKGLRKEIGLLINFGPSGVDVKRKYREVDKGE